MVLLLMTIMIIFLLLGFPMFISMIVASMAILLQYYPNVNLIMVVQQLMQGVSPFVLLAVPMFIFAADIMSVGHTSNRLVDFVQAFVGHIHGGLAITTAGACTLFGAISGSTQATVVAIGKPMRSNLLKAGYNDSDVQGLIISAANIALLIPPSIVMIMYCVVTGASVGELFIAGIGPGLLMFFLFAIYNYFDAKRKVIPRRKKTILDQKIKAFKNALLPLGFPTLIIGGIYSGFFSPTEAAAASVLYAIIIEVLIYKSIKFKDIYSIALSTGLITSAVFILIASGQIFSWVISYAKIPQVLTMALLGPSPSAIKILFMVTIFFFIGCMFVDQVVVIIILTPIFYPIAMQAGIDPIHLGIVVTIQAAVGSVTPPFGCNIFTACAVFDKPYMEVVKGLPAYMLIFIIVSVIMVFFPEVAVGLRDLVM